MKTFKLVPKLKIRVQAENESEAKKEAEEVLAETFEIYPTSDIEIEMDVVEVREEGT